MSKTSDMEVFLLTVKSGSLSAAARHLDLTPAAISYRISKLERDLGTRLLHRTTRRLVITQDGAEYLRQAEEMVHRMQSVEAAVSRRDKVVRGTLKFTAPASFGRQFIAPLLPAFLERHPMVRLNFVMSDEMLDIVGEGFDLAVRIAKLNDSQMIARKLAPDRRVVCASPSYLERHGVPKSPSDLERHNCLVLSQQPYWVFDGPSGRERVRVSGTLECNNGEVIREAALAGVGIALKATWDISFALKIGRLCTVLENYPVASDAAICAIYPSRQNVPAKTRAFIAFLKERLRTELVS